MAKVKLTAGVKHGDTWYKPGDVFDGDQETVDYLIKVGAARDPKADADKVVVDTSAAEAQAKEIVEAAEKQLADAKTQAEKTVKEATEQAAKIVDDAKTQAEKTVKEATEQAAKKAPESKTGQQTK